jgi:hypothetical protein
MMNLEIIISISESLGVIRIFLNTVLLTVQRAKNMC